MRQIVAVTLCGSVLRAIRQVGLRLADVGLLGLEWPGGTFVRGIPNLRRTSPQVGAQVALSGRNRIAAVLSIWLNC
jgi:hypothetical protein